MVDFRAFALSAVAVVALSSVAAAADLLPPPPPMEPPPPMAADMGGWYLRGDTGIGFNNSVGAETTPNPLNSFTAGQANDNWYNNALSEAALFDIGVGYQINPWFRADVTGELRGGSEFSGLEVLNVTSGPFAGYQAADFYKGHVSSLLGMVNGYVDLGTWYGITPFVGAGVGVSFNHFYGGQDNGVISNGGMGSSPSGGVFGNGTKANLAWALMAGFDMSVARNLKLELGYRYLSYGKFNSGASQCLSGNGNVGSFSAPNCGGGFALASRNLSSNDFRIGLRYYLDNDMPAPNMPLVRKY
ncbi:MAG: porin family protein [Pseudomonadota bacterium]|nr:porin family protein [Pseudomonadota bacterium]